MSDPYLILHKVRGEPAFDVAIQMECPICKDRWEHEDWECGECNDEKCWWIISTSGHRAYPYWHEQLNKAVDFEMCRINGNELKTLPNDWPDHYAINNSPIKHEPRTTLLDQLGLSKASKIVRRI